MRRLLAVTFALSLALLLLAGQAHAQYGPPSPQPAGSTAGFYPTAKTSAVSASNASANILLATSFTNVINQVQVYNATTVPAFVLFCSQPTCTASAGSVGTSTSDYPIGPGAVIVITVPAGTQYAAVILGSSSGLVYFTPGVGL